MRAIFRCVAYAETRLPEEEENPVRLWEQRPLQKCATSVNSEHASLPNLRGECKSLVAYHFAVVVQFAGHRPRNAMIPVQLRAMAPFLPGRLNSRTRSSELRNQRASRCPAASCARSIEVMPRFVEPTKSERYRPGTPLKCPRHLTDSGCDASNVVMWVQFLPGVPSACSSTD